MKRFIQKGLCVALCLTLVCLSALVFPVVSRAEQLALVTTVNDPLTMRSGPGTSYSRVGTAPKGSLVTLLDTSNANWYLIRSGTVEGYASSTYLRVVSSASDADFETYLTAQGFPDSYKPALRILHNLHPNWIFTVNSVDVDFWTAVSAECKPGLSVVVKRYALGSELSYEQGTYNFDTGEHIVFDSGGWVAASTELVAYALDPRNYLTADYVFAFLNMSSSASETYQGIANIAKGSFLDAAYPDGLEDSAQFATYSDAILEASRQSGVSAYHLTSYILTEQGRNGTELAHGTTPGYEGYYNFLNIGAYMTSSMTAHQRGGYTAQQQGWNTPYKAILGGARTLANGYINVGQNNGYLKKFDFAATGGFYTHQYMSNIKAVFSEASKLATAYANVLDNAYNFQIPVFKNMPASACAAPTSTGSNNNVLRSLSVNGQVLTPSFDKYTYNYDLIVDSSVSSVQVSAAAYDDTASVAGTGTTALNDGNNTIAVVVTAASGTQRAYKLSVYRQPGGSGSGTSAGITIKGSYSVGTYITGVQPGTSVPDFASKLGVSGASVEVRSADGTVKTAGNIATGDRVNLIRNNTAELSYIVVIYGDVNGDGKISTVDLFRGQGYILQRTSLSAEQSAACDINHDGKVSTVDLFIGQKHILNIASISQ